MRVPLQDVTASLSLSVPLPAPRLTGRELQRLRLLEPRLTGREFESLQLLMDRPHKAAERSWQATA